MSASAVPTVITRLLATMPGKVPANTAVRDGFDISGDPSKFLMVGVEDPDAAGYETSGSSTQDWAGVGNYRRNESGEVVCCALAWDAAGKAAAARTQAYGIVDAVADALVQDPNLGSGDPTLICAYGGRHALNQSLTNAGALALVTFTVAFTARL